MLDVNFFEQIQIGLATADEIRGLGLNIQLEKKKGLGPTEEDKDLM